MLTIQDIKRTNGMSGVSMRIAWQSETGFWKANLNLCNGICLNFKFQ